MGKARDQKKAPHSERLFAIFGLKIIGMVSACAALKIDSLDELKLAYCFMNLLV